MTMFKSMLAIKKQVTDVHMIVCLNT